VLVQASEHLDMYELLGILNRQVCNIELVDWAHYVHASSLHETRLVCAGSAFNMGPLLLCPSCIAATYQHGY
jgi:hypothetical protein